MTKESFMAEFSPEFQRLVREKKAGSFILIISLEDDSTTSCATQVFLEPSENHKLVMARGHALLRAMGSVMLEVLRNFFGFDGETGLGAASGILSDVRMALLEEKETADRIRMAACPFPKMPEG